MKKILTLSLLVCACHDAPKKPSVQPVADIDSIPSKSIVVAPPKKAVQQELPARHPVELRFDELAQIFYDSLDAFHAHAKVYDSITGYDFAELYLLEYRDTLYGDSSTKKLMVRSDYYQDHEVRQLYVRYEYRTTTGLESTLFYIWKNPKSKKIEWESVERTVEISPNAPGDMPQSKSFRVEQDDLKPVMKLFLHQVTTTKVVFYLQKYSKRVMIQHAKRTTTHRL